MLISCSKPMGHLSFDSSSGDYIEYLSPAEIYLRTVFNYRKPLTPRVDPATTKHAAPPSPVPLTATWGVASWIWGGAPMTGAQFDALSKYIFSAQDSNSRRPSCRSKPPSETETGNARQASKAAYIVGSCSGEKGAGLSTANSCKTCSQSDSSWNRFATAGGPV